jgi:hypothetical protein
MLLVVHKRVHSLIRLFCFVGEYFRPGQGLRTLAKKAAKAAATAVVAAATGDDFDWGKLAFAMAMLALAGFMSWAGR